MPTRFVWILLLLGSSSWGGEQVIFTTGSRLHVDRHEDLGDGKIRLYTGSAEIVVDAARVRGYEAEEKAPAKPAEAPAASQETGPSPAELADAAADKYGLPRSLVRSVMAAESALNPQAVSPKGAVGLMQLMPSTAKALGANPYDPAQNADAGARYLRDLLLKYDGRLWHALAAYNAGPDAVDKYKGVPPYPETVEYIGRIARKYQKQPE